MADIEALYKRGDEAFKKSNWDYARDLFQQILVFEPDHANSRKALKATLLRKFQTMGATSKIKLIAIKGQFEIQLKATKDPAKRIDLCQKFLNDDPTNAKVRAILAETLLGMGKNAGAAAEAELALADDKANIQAAKALVEACKNLGDVKKAQGILDKLVSLVKEDRDLERLQRDLAAMSTMKQGFDSAGSFRDVIKDKDAAAELEKRAHLIQTDEEFKSVILGFEAEAIANPADPKPPKRIGDLYFEKKKDYKTAQEYYRKASGLAPQDSVLRDKVDDCEIRLYQGKIDAAQKAGDPKLNELRLEKLKFDIKSFERRVNERPTDMGLRFDLGRAYFQGGLVDKSIGEFQQSVKDPKRKNDSHFYLGWCFQKKKMFDMAEKQYIAAEENVLSQDRRCQILYQRALCHFEAGRKEKAIELGNMIIEIDINYKDIADQVAKWQAA
jgi:tetratricopeptide (TPR) repeat protein